MTKQLADEQDAQCITGSHPGDLPPSGEVRSIPDLAPWGIDSLIRQHHEAVFRYAYRLCGSVHDAEDLCQQTFLTAHAKLDQLRELAAARSWLFTVLRNAYLKLVKKRAPLRLSDCAIEADAIPDELPGGWLIDRESLQAAINQLPDEYKLVLLLFYFEECSYREIAQKLAAPIGTVMSRLSRAKSQLRARLLEQDDRLLVTLPGSDGSRVKAQT